MTPPATGRPVLEGAAILRAWSEASSLAPAQRALVLVRHAEMIGSEDAGSWSVGRRDAALLDLYAATFGPRVTATTPCPHCREEVEIGFDIDGIRAPYGDTSEQFEIAPANDAADRIVFRLPTVSEVAQAASQPGPRQMQAREMRRALAERCVVSAERQGRPSALATIPDEVVAEVGEAMAAHDPQADVALALSCPTCHHDWSVRFDIADFAWMEVTAEARRLLVEVHTLASAYGWSEPEILQLPASRRRAYLEFLAG